MAKEFSRLRRVEELLSRKLAELIQRELKDPRIGLVSLSEVRVSKDMAHAKIFFTCLHEEAAAITETGKALNQAKSYLRKLLAETVKLRTIPALSFIYDESAERGRRINQLIDDEVKKFE